MSGTWYMTHNYVRDLVHDTPFFGCIDEHVPVLDVNCTCPRCHWNEYLPSHHVSKYFGLLQFRTFRYLSYVVTNQVAPVVTFHIEILFLELTLTL